MRSSLSWEGLRTTAKVPFSPSIRSTAMHLLVWDFNGTLGYRDDHWRGALRDLLAAEAPEFLPLPEVLPAFFRAAFPWRHPEIPHPHLNDAASWWAALEPTFEQTFVTLGLDPARADRFSRRVRHYYRAAHRWHLYPDVLPALDALSAEGWQHALLTNHVPDLPQILDALGIADRFIHIGNSAATGYEKPHPRAFAALAEAVGPTDEIWMIGDSPTADYDGATRAGWNALLVRQESFSDHPSITTLASLAPFLDSVACTSPVAGIRQSWSAPPPHAWEDYSGSAVPTPQSL